MCSSPPPSARILQAALRKCRYKPHVSHLFPPPCVLTHEHGGPRTLCVDLWQGPMGRVGRVQLWERLLQGGRQTGWAGEPTPHGSAPGASLSACSLSVFRGIRSSAHDTVQCGFLGLSHFGVKKARLRSVDGPKQLSDSEQPGPDPVLLPTFESATKGARPLAQPRWGHLGSPGSGHLWSQWLFSNLHRLGTTRVILAGGAFVLKFHHNSGQ